jgi:hypothetical protein
MFGNKKDGFKYENEVKSLIQEATNSLHQRILSLETQNQQLIQELYHLKNGICQDFQRLEQRITDFTDVWHPIMIQNINRIKKDLEKTIVKTEREDINKIQKELEQKIATIFDNNKSDIALKKILRLSEHIGCCIKLQDIKKHFDDELVRWETEKKTKYDPINHGKQGFYFEFGQIYEFGINIVDDNNNIIINGSNTNINHPADMLLEDGWKMFIHEIPFVILYFGNHNRFKPTLFPNKLAPMQLYNEYVLSPMLGITSSKRNKIINRFDY